MNQDKDFRDIRDFRKFVSCIYFASRENLEKKLESISSEKEKYNFLTKLIAIHQIKALAFAKSATQTKEGYETYRQSIKQARMIKELAEDLYRNNRNFRKYKGIIGIYHSLLELDRSVIMHYARDVLLPAVKGKHNWDNELRELMKER